MKKMAYLLFIVLVTGCSSNYFTTMVYSSDFRINLSQEHFKGAYVFSTPDLSIKTREGKLLSGTVLTPGTDGLPHDFDMRQYPLYLQNSEIRSTLVEAAAAILAATAAEIEHTYGRDALQITTHNQWTSHQICKDDRCLTLISMEEQPRQLLNLHSKGFEAIEIIEILKAGL